MINIPPRKNRFSPALVCLLLALFFLFPHQPFHIHPDTENSYADVINISSPSGDHESEDTRYINRLVEEFVSLDNVSMSNTSVIVDTFNGKVTLMGSGTPKSNIRQVTNHDHFVGHGGFNSMAVDENGRYYHLNGGGGTTVEIFASWNDYFNGQPNIDNMNVPESQHSTQMFVANGHLYTSSESSNNLRKVRLADKQAVNSNINHARTTNWGWRGPQQQGVACDGTYIYTWCDTTLKIWDMNENLIRTVSGLPNKGGYGTCFAVGHYFYCVDYSQAHITHRVDADSGTVHAYTNEVFISSNYVVDASYDYFHNRLFTSRGWQDTYAMDNVAYTWGNQMGFTNGTIQSLPMYMDWPAIGAAKIIWYENKPAGTDIIYNLTVDGENWITMENNTDFLFTDRGSRLMWNATMTTSDDSVTPFIERIIIEYDLISDPEPYFPQSSVWHGDSTPTLKWNFTDPDAGDHQSDFILEIYNDTGMHDQIYNSSWVNSTLPEHKVPVDLDDGQYYWRVKTKDAYHAMSNYSSLKSFKIDTAKPVGNITIEGGQFDPESTNSQLVTLRIYAEDNASGVDEMQVMNDQGIAQQWEPYKEEKGISLSPEDGLKTIGVRFRDNAGIVSEIFNDTIYLDYLGPGFISISSPTHPDPEMYYNSTDPIFNWEHPGEVTGIKGYSYHVDKSPLSEPYKDITNPASAEINFTSPREFSGLKEGTYYFHITACDVYNQWGNTSHFQFNIDSKPPLISSLLPAEGPWFRNSGVKVSAVFEDKGGFGLALDRISYSYKLSGTSHFSDWTAEGVEIEILDTGIADNPSKVSAEALVTLSEGPLNYVRWRVTDLAGNGPLLSEEMNVRIDQSPVVFGDFSIENMDDPPEVQVSIEISDRYSGVDPGRLKYSISTEGSENGSFGEWQIPNPLDIIMGDPLKIYVAEEYEWGRSNYIRFSAGDVAGTGSVISDPYRINVTSVPEAVITLPAGKRVQFKHDQEVAFDASASTDLDGDALNYSWRSNISGFLSSNMSFTSMLDPGNHTITLYVTDIDGNNVSDDIKVDVEGGKKSKPTSGDDDGGLDNVINVGGNGWSWWWILLLILLLLLILIIVFILIRRRKKDEETPKNTPSGGPPSQPGQAPPPLRYPYYPAPVYRGGPAQQPHASPSTRPGYGSPAGIYPANTPSQQNNLPSSNVNAPPSSPPPKQLPPPPSGAGPESALPRLSPPSTPAPEPEYLLPTFSSAGGDQDLNRMALPPAPDEVVPEKGTEGEPGRSLQPPPAAGSPLAPAGVESGSTSSESPSMDDIFGDLEKIAGPQAASAEQPPGPSDQTPPIESLTLQCHSCKDQYTAVIEGYPALVTCNHCGTQGQING